MIFIAHRGNILGPNKLEENKQETIDNAINKGFDVETDIWILENNIYLGHDKPEILISLCFLSERKEKLWCHAKNFTALEFLLKNNFHCFTHDKDDATLTSKNYVWTYPGKELIDNSIAVMPEYTRKSFSISENNKIVGVCSDYIEKLRSEGFL